MNKKTLKMIGNITLNVLLYVFLALCILSVVITVFSKKDVDGAAEVFGYQMRIVTSSSMEACELTDVSGYEIGSIPLRSMIFVETMPDDPTEATEWYRSLKVGDVLTFRYVYTTQVTITHRIVAITERAGSFIIELEGDNKNTEDGQITQVIDTSIPNNTNYVIGKVTGQAYLLGFLISLLTTTLGMIFIIILPCTVIIVLEVIKIVRTFGAEKKKREQQEKEQKENELAELRRRLAELEKGAQSPEAPPTQSEE